MKPVGRLILASVLCVSATILASAPPALAQPTVTASDPDDVAGRLDLRSATLSPESGDRARITLTFWNRVPPRLLERRSIRLELDPDDDRPHSAAYSMAFFRNSSGIVRMTWGEAGSNCCFVTAASHPDDFTYTGVLPFSIYGAVPPPAWLRGVATKRLDCGATRRRACILFLGRAADKTPWVEV